MGALKSQQAITRTDGVGLATGITARILTGEWIQEFTGRAKNAMRIYVDLQVELATKIARLNIKDQASYNAANAL